ncbi:MAG: hypothetical protein ABSD99_01585 [Candidatus Bathyarchaeia archaeon]
MRTAGRSVVLALLIMSIALLYLLPPEPVRATSPITLDWSASAICAYPSCELTTPTKLTWSHTVGSGSNRILLVGISYVFYTGPASVASVTYGTPCPGPSCLSLTLIPGATHVQPTDDVHAELWALQNPPTGTATITVTFGGGTFPNDLLFAVAGSVSYFNVASTGTPVGSDGRTFTTGLSATESVATGPNDVVVDTIAFCDCTGSASPPTTVTASGLGQTQHWNAGSLNDASGETFAGGGSDQPASGSSVTMSWSLVTQEPTLSSWSLIAVPLTPTVTTTTTTSPPIPEYPLGLPILALLMIIGYGVIRRKGEHEA